LSENARYNDQIPTDPYFALILILAITYAATQLTTDQAQALVSTGGIAELALLFLRLIYERR
jgi:hypothetical protein